MGEANPSPFSFGGIVDKKDGLADYYYDLISNSSNPGTKLATFFCEYFSKPPTVDDYKIFNRLTRLYGKQAVFFGLLDLFSVQNLDLNSYDRLLAYIIKKRMADHNGTTKSQDLSNYLEKLRHDLDKQVNRKTKLKFKDPFKDVEHDS